MLYLLIISFMVSGLLFIDLYVTKKKIALLERVCLSDTKLLMDLAEHCQNTAQAIDLQTKGLANNHERICDLEDLVKNALSKDQDLFVDLDDDEGEGLN